MLGKGAVAAAVRQRVCAGGVTFEAMAPSVACFFWSLLGTAGPEPLLRSSYRRSKPFYQLVVRKEQSKTGASYGVQSN